MAIVIDINPEDKYYIVSGCSEAMSADRRLKLSLKDQFDVVEIVEGTVKIKFTNENKDECLTRLKSFFKHHGLKDEPTEILKDVMADYYRREEEFEKFSKLALDIRNNKTNKADFENFVQIVASKFGLNRTLYPRQLLSAYHLAFSQNACNFSVPGSGKTSIVYGAYAYLASLNSEDPKHVDKIFIVGPLSSFAPWENEYKGCFGKEPDIVRLSGISKEDRRRHLNLTNTAEIFLISYQGVVNSIEMIQQFLLSNKVMVVLDEAHKIKNTEGGLTAETVLKLTDNANSRVVLTGTPAPNGYEDLYNLFEFIWPEKKVTGYNLMQLKRLTKRGRADMVRRLTGNVAPYFMRIKKKDLNLPKVNDHAPIMINMGNIQKEIYDSIAKSCISRMEKELRRRTFNSDLARARWIRLMQIATNVSLLASPLDKYLLEGGMSDSLFTDDPSLISKIKDYSSLETPPKFVKVLELLKEILVNKEKVVIWSNYIRNIEDLKSFLREHKYKSKIIYGGTPVESEGQADDVETREKIIKEFNDSDSDLRVLIANPFATSESISLHKVCHHAIYMDRTFNATHFMQSKDRIHRYGLKETDETNYYYLMSDNTIDETIHSRLEEKERRMLEIIDRDEIPLLNMNMDYEYDSTDDIKAIIKDYYDDYKKY